MKLKHALIIPGFAMGEAPFDYVEKSFSEIGIQPVFVPINWRRTVLTQNIAEFQDNFKKYDPACTVVFGFSLGAMIALIASAEQNPAILILASMVPWFAEDIPNRSEHHKNIVGKRRLEVYKNTHFDNFANKINSKAYIIVGENEGRRWPAYIDRARAAHEKIERSEFILVPRAEHKIDDIVYKNEVQKIISEISKM